MKNNIQPTSLCEYLSSVQTTKVESAGIKSPAGLNTLFKLLLLDEEFRENFLKCAGKATFEKIEYGLENFDYQASTLPFAEQLILDIECENERDKIRL